MTETGRIIRRIMYICAFRFYSEGILFFAWHFGAAALWQKFGGNIIVKKICDFVVRNMCVFVFLAGVLGAIYPPSLAWIKAYVSVMLGLVMFGMGMTLRFSDFSFVLKRPWEIFLGALAQFTIMPAAAWLLVKIFSLPPEVAIGVILLGACPGGTASNVITYLAHGHVAYSVAMTMTTTLLAPLVTPLITYYLAGAWIEISLTAMMISIAQMVLAPVVLGLFINHFCGDKLQKVVGYMPFFSVVMIVLLVGGVVALSADKLAEMGVMIALIVALHNALGIFCGYAMAKAFRLEPRKARALAIEVGMQNSGMAASLAVMYFNAAAALPGAIFSVWHNISGSLAASYFVRKDTESERKKFSRSCETLS